MDKGDVVRLAATSAVKSILKLCPPESTRIVFETLEKILDGGKWRTKVGVLDAMKSFVVPARDAVAAQLGEVLPKVEGAMHDTKQEVSLFQSCTIQQLSHHIFSGLQCSHQMRNNSLHDSRQPGSYSSHPSSRQVHVRSRLSRCLHQSIIVYDLCCRSHIASFGSTCPTSCPRAQRQEYGGPASHGRRYRQSR